MSEENIVDNNILSDQAVNCIDEDLFDFKNHALNLASILAGKNAKPGTVVGVSGSWGSGKSSVLNLVKCILKGETSKTDLGFNQRIAELIDANQLPIIFEFDPWLINNKDEMIKRFFNGLISTIQYSQNKNVDKLTWAVLSILQCFQNGAKTITDLLSSIEVTIPIGPSVATFKPATLTKNWKKGIEKSIHSIQCDNKYTYNTLKNELSAELSSENRRIVIFIDDMDRLLGEEVMSVLKLIRMITDIPFFNCIIAYDEVQTSRAIDQFCGGNGKEYIRKMINVPTYTPEIIIHDVQAIISKSLNVSVFPGSRYILNEAEQKNYSFVLGILIQVLRTHRQTKLFLNTFNCLFSDILKKTSITDGIALCLLYMFCPLVFQAIKKLDWPFFPNEQDKYNKILDILWVLNGKDNIQFGDKDEESYFEKISAQKYKSGPEEFFDKRYVSMFGHHWAEGIELVNLILKNEDNKGLKYLNNWKKYFCFSPTDIINVGESISRKELMESKEVID